MKSFKLFIADILTFTRIILSFILLFFKPFSIGFFIVYTLCGISDMTDGAAARKFGTANIHGVLFDSIADIIFTVASAILILPSIRLFFPFRWWFYPLILIAVIKAVSLIGGLLKLRRLFLPHTVLNKITGGAVFVLPFFYSVDFFSVIFVVVCTVALIAATEELILMLKLKKE